MFLMTAVRDEDTVLNHSNRIKIECHILKLIKIYVDHYTSRDITVISNFACNELALNRVSLTFEVVDAKQTLFKYAWNIKILKIWLKFEASGKKPRKELPQCPNNPFGKYFENFSPNKNLTKMVGRVCLSSKKCWYFGS